MSPQFASWFADNAATMNATGERKSRIVKGDGSAEFESDSSRADEAATNGAEDTEPTNAGVATTSSASLEQLDAELAEHGDQLLEFASVEDLLGEADEENKPMGEPLKSAAAPDATPDEPAIQAEFESASTPPDHVERTLVKDKLPSEEEVEMPIEVDIPACEPVSGPPKVRGANIVWLGTSLQRAFLRLLNLLALPCELLPGRYRPMLDWVALSLVFWIPVVWIIVLVMLRR